jgi:hypothetical protein
MNFYFHIRHIIYIDITLFESAIVFYIICRINIVVFKHTIIDYRKMKTIRGLDVY